MARFASGVDVVGGPPRARQTEQVVVLRAPGESDVRPMAEAWYEAEQRSLQDGYPDGYPSEWFWMTSIEQVEAQWARGFLGTQPPTEAWVAVLAGEPVGFARAGQSDADPGLGVLQSLYVAPAAWGSGAGSELHGAAIGSLASRSSRAELWVIEGNAKTRRFYEGRGWVAAGESMRVDGGLPLVRYVRSLT